MYDIEPVNLADLVHKHFGVVGLVVFWILVLIIVAVCVVLSMMAWF